MHIDLTACRIQPRLQAFAVRCDRVAEREVDERNEHQALDVELPPLDVTRGEPNRAEQIEQADDDDEARVLEESDEGIDHRRDHELQRLRQDDEPHLVPVAQS